MPETETSVTEFDVCLTIPQLRRALFVWQIRKWWTWLLLAVACLMLIGSLVGLLRGQGIQVVPLCVALTWLALPFLLPVLQIRKANLGKDALATAHYRVDESGIRRTTSSTNIELSWTALYGFRETSDNFLVLTRRNCFIVIPKQSLGDRLILSRTAELLAKHLQRR